MEIRRRATGLDIPARGIIRGRGEIETYVFNVGLVDRWFVGEETTAAPKAERDVFPWPQPLSAAIQEIAEPARQGDIGPNFLEVALAHGLRNLLDRGAERLGPRERIAFGFRRGGGFRGPPPRQPQAPRGDAQ